MAGAGCDLTWMVDARAKSQARCHMDRETIIMSKPMPRPMLLMFRCLMKYSFETNVEANGFSMTSSPPTHLQC